jgi:hypothetical protein
MPKVDGTPTKGEITSEQLKATKAELTRMAQQLELERESLSEKLAAASLAEQLRLIRTEKQHQPARTGGRPSDYTEEAGAALIQWITEGKSLRSWTRQTGISVMTVYRWAAQEATFREQYARAHEHRSDTLADEILDIADETAGTDSIAAVKAAQLRIETRKWIAAKLKPQKWGDKQIVEQTGSVTFSLGIPSRTPPPVTIEGSAFEIKDLPARLADCESDSRPPASPSPVVSSSREGDAQGADTP